MGHQAHREDFSTTTQTDNAMQSGYTISNNDAHELSYDTELYKVTRRSGKNVASELMAGNDVTITSTDGNNVISGSKLTAMNNININANNGSTLITSARDTSFLAESSVTQDYNNVDFEYHRGRVSANAEMSVEERDAKETRVTQVKSQLLSGGSININSQNDIDILSSNLTADNQINLVSDVGDVNIGANSDNILTEEEIREGVLRLSAGVGHVAFDTYYAADDLVKAGEALKKAKENLSRMKRWKKEGRADTDAVRDAELNLTLATLNLAMAYLKMAATSDKIRNTTNSYGFYADLQITRSGQKTNNSSSSNNEVGSGLWANNDILINSGLDLVVPDSERGNTNIKGMVISNNGDISITSNNDTNITALENSFASKMKSEGFSNTITAGASYGQSPLEAAIQSLAAQIGFNRSKSKADNIYYANTSLFSENGKLEITSLNDTNISGANLLARDLVINSANNLKIESLQNKQTSKFKAMASSGGGGRNSVSSSFDYSNNKLERNWVDDQTDVIGTNSVSITTGNNTNLNGSLLANITNATSDNISLDSKQIQESRIDGGNLTLTTGSLTYGDLLDKEENKSVSFGNQFNISSGGKKKKEAKQKAKDNISGNNTNADNPNQDKHNYPRGSATFSASSKSYKKEQRTKATLGKGTIIVGGKTLSDDDIELVGLNRDVTNSQEITSDMITGALEFSTTIDNRVWSEKGRKDIRKEANVKRVLENLAGNAGLVVNNAGDVVKAVKKFKALFPNATEKQRKEFYNKLTMALINNDREMLKPYKDKYKLEDSETEAVRGYIMGEISGKDLLIKTDKETQDLLFMQVGIGFDGTSNNKDVDPLHKTNVARMDEAYPENSDTSEKIYEKGVGSDGVWYDFFCQATGCGGKIRETRALTKLRKIYNDPKNSEKLFLIDAYAFSRGSAQARDFANQIFEGVDGMEGNALYLRSLLLYDTVASFGKPGNDLDLGYNLNTNFGTNTLVVHAVAADETRKNFPLQSILNSDGTVNSPYMIEKVFRGVHADLGGSYAPGDQGKKADIQFQTLNWMVEQARDIAGVPFNENIIQQYQVSDQFRMDYGDYEQAQDALLVYPYGTNVLNAENASNIFRENYIHSEVNTGWKFWNNETKDGKRVIYHPNDQQKKDLQDLIEQKIETKN